jgi:hypothetical protein
MLLRVAAHNGYTTQINKEDHHEGKGIGDISENGKSSCDIKWPRLITYWNYRMKKEDKKSI